jgi:hypothetical protein
MPKIKNIQQDSAVTAGDKVLGSDTSGATRNYTMQQIANFVVESGSSHKHHQNTDSNEWTIVHNFELSSYLPSVVVTLDDGTHANVSAFGQVKYIDKNTLKIFFAASYSGFAYLTK